MSETPMDFQIDFYIGAAWVNVTQDVLFPIKLDVGIRGGKITDRVARPGTLQFKLENSALNENGLLGYWTPGHTNAPADWTETARVRMRFYWREAGGAWRIRMRGLVTGIKPALGELGERTVDVTCKDYMHDLQAFTKADSLALLTNTTSDVGYAAIIAAMELPVLGGTNIDTGVSTIPALFHKQSGRPSGYSEVVKIAQSEFEYVWVNGNGQFNVQNRTHRLDDTSIKFTIDNTMLECDMDYDVSAVPDKFVMNCYPMEISNTDQDVVASLANVQTIRAGETVTFDLKYKDANGGGGIGAMDVTTSPDTSSYDFGTHPDGNDNSLNANLSITVTPAGTACSVSATNNGSGLAYLTRLEVLGRAIQTYDKITKEADVSTAYTTDEIVTVDLLYGQTAEYAEGAAGMAADVYGKVYPKSVTIIAGHGVSVPAVTTSGIIGNRIRVISDVQNVDHEMFINGISATITDRNDVRVKYILGPAVTTASVGAFTIGTSTIGGSDLIYFSGG